MGDPTEEKNEHRSEHERASRQLVLMMEQGRSFSGHERNCCFLNLPNGRFATISAASGLDFPDDARVVAVVDWDQDGDSDLWIANRNAPRLRLMRNDSSNGHHFLTLHLQGNGKTTSRDAIGARVEVISEDLQNQRLIRTLRAGEGFLAQSGKAITIGLGTVDKIEKLLVDWPGGEREEIRNVAVDHHYRLVQGTGKATLVETRAKPKAITPSKQPEEKVAGSMHVPLITPLPMPRNVRFSGFDGTERQLSFGGGKKHKLIVLWASWCLPCWKELEDLTKNHDRLQSAGVDVVALAVDGLGDDRSNPAMAEKLVRKLGIPFATGQARADLVQLMTGYHNVLVAIKKQLPVPTSFLIDPQGRLSVIYKGRVNADQVLKDAQPIPKDFRDRWERAALLPGRRIEHDDLFRTLRHSEAATLYAMGEHFVGMKQFENAEPHLRGALAAEPDFGKAHQLLAQVLQVTQQLDESAKEYVRAIRYFPKRASLHHNLGDVRYQQGRWKDALSDYKKAIRLQRDFWPAHLGRANALVKLKRIGEAKEAYRRALQINPNLTGARQTLAQLGG